MGRDRASLEAELKRLRARNRELEERHQIAADIYRAIGELIPFGIWVCAPDGGVRYLSQSYLDRMGVRLEDCHSYNWLSHLDPDQVEPMLAAWEKCRREEGYWKWAHRMRDRNGEWVWILSRGVPIRDQDGIITCWAGINLDITDRKQIEDELEAARAVAENAVQARTRFLAAASHDLRQPVQSLVLFSEMLRAHAAGGPLEKIALSIDGATDALRRLLASILDFTKLDAGQIKPQMAEVDLGELIARLGSEYQARGIAKGLSVRAVPPRRRIVTDPALLERMLRNLVENAIRYTQTGEILIGTRTKGGLIRLDVIDTGPGIPEDNLPTIFEEFTQIDTRRGVNGLGLGLAIVKRTARLLDAQVEVASVPGQGSRFSILLPTGNQA